MRNLFPDVPVGLGSKLGIGGGFLAAVAAALVSLLDGDQTTESTGLVGFAAVLLYAVIRGRMDQSAAAAAGTASRVELEPRAGTTVTSSAEGPRPLA